jgi:hypothetical protein
MEIKKGDREITNGNKKEKEGERKGKWIKTKRKN